MINVEADVLAGPLLVRKAKEAGIIYSMAYGDQPALIAEMVDWARTAGLYVLFQNQETETKLTRFIAMSSAPEKAQNIYQNSTLQHQTLSGRIMVSRKSNSLAEISIHRCSTPFWTELNPLLRWQPLPTVVTSALLVTA